ncbi:hypothetical protein QO005_000706 [Rhizobium paknamense]|uniref:Uncharacterized protein n=1 Tax=Rhizobium paknamense TaxID=1206817 RepID=A0ABU0I824_9HYPH|nr:hypothetical protein [Rhizobium paknamense]
MREILQNIQAFAEFLECVEPGCGPHGVSPVQRRKEHVHVG